MPGAVRIELAALQSLEREFAAHGDDWLTQIERERVASMRSVPRRRQFLAGHWLARRLAAQHSGGSPRDWHWQDGDRRRSVTCAGGLTWCASIAHSGDWVAVALHGSALGVDLEFARRERDVAALARQIASPRELVEFAGQLRERRSDAFYRLWSLKEAQGKREGLGLRPEIARTLAAGECDRAIAEAITWSVPDGSLALCGPVACDVELGSALPLGIRRFWRFTADREDSNGPPCSTSDPAPGSHTRSRE